MTLRRHSLLSKNVARALRQRLRREYQSGGRLPSELEIAQEYGVSRGTIRDALAILEREGVIFRRQGSGTYVNQYALNIQASIESAYEFTDLIRQAGYQAEIRPLSVERQPLPADIAARLERPPDSDALFVRKLFLADGEPAIYCLDVLPTDLVREPYQPEELHAPIFDFMRQRCYQTVSLVLADIIPQVTEGQLAELLQSPLGQALLQFDEVSFNTLNKPVLFSRVYYRDGYVRFSVLRKKM